MNKKLKILYKKGDLIKYNNNVINEVKNKIGIVFIDTYEYENNLHLNVFCDGQIWISYSNMEKIG